MTRPGLIERQVIVSGGNEITRKPKALRYQLRNAAAKIMQRKRFEGQSHRVCSCGSRMSEMVTIVRSKRGTCDYLGIRTCGSIWACPVCSAKIAAHRAKEVSSLVNAHALAGGQTYMLTLTLQHSRKQSLEELRAGIASAWTKFRRSKAFKTIRTDYGQQHYVKAFEVTHGKNGWHPHFHVLLMLDHRLSDECEAEFRDVLFEGWQKAVDRAGFWADPAGLDLRRATDATSASNYVAKWGTAAEITKGLDKSGRQGSRTPWQILADAGRGCWQSKRLYREYVRTMYGCRHLITSRGARDAYDLEAVADDAQIADAPELGLGDDYQEIYQIDKGTWASICKAGLQGEVLVAADLRGKSGVHDFLCDEGICPSYMKPPDERWHARPKPQPNWAPGEQQNMRSFFKWLKESRSSKSTEQALDIRAWDLVLLASKKGLLPHSPGQSVSEAKVLARDLERAGKLSLDSLILS